MLEQDSDVYKWGQSFFDTYSFFNTVYMTDAFDQGSSSIYHVNYPMNPYETEYSNVENDEIIAHTLQEEFSHLAMREMSENYHVPEQDSSIPVDQQDWHSSPTRHYNSGA